MLLRKRVLQRVYKDIYLRAIIATVIQLQYG